MNSIATEIQAKAVIADFDSNVISNETAEKLMNMDLLSAHLPYKFANGNTIERMEIGCAKCGCILEEVRGEIRETNKGMTLALDAYGICRKEECLMITPVVARFRDDGTYLCKAGNTWKERRYAPLVGPGVGNWLKAKLISLWHKP